MIDFKYFQRDAEFLLEIRGGAGGNSTDATAFLDQHPEAKKLRLSFHNRLSDDQTVGIFAAISEKLPHLDSFTFLADAGGSFPIKALDNFLRLRVATLIRLEIYSGHVLRGTELEFESTFSRLSQCTGLRSVLFHSRFVSLENKPKDNDHTLIKDDGQGQEHEHESWFSSSLLRALSEIETLDTLSLELWSPPYMKASSGFARLLNAKNSGTRLSLTIDCAVSTWKTLSLSFMQRLFSKKSRLVKVTLSNFDNVNCTTGSIAKGLQSNQSIKEFSVRTSQKGDRQRFNVHSVVKLLVALHGNTVLEVLEMPLKWGQWFTARSGPQLTRSIQEVTYLRKLELWLPAIEKREQLVAIFLGIVHNSTLEEVLLHVEYLDDQTKNRNMLMEMDETEEWELASEMEEFEMALETRNTWLRRLCIVNDDLYEEHTRFFTRKALFYMKLNQTGRTDRLFRSHDPLLG
jgi:hypothetical protein